MTVPMLFLWSETTQLGEKARATEELFEPDASVAWIAHGQRPIEATGLDEARQSWLDWLEPWETYRAQIERIVPVDDKVLVLARVHGRMAGTENDVELIFGSIYVLRADG